MTSAGFVVLANAAAGSVDDRSLAAAVAELAHHGPTVVRRTEGPDDVDEALGALDGRRPIVVGGDGSLHLAVNRLLALGLGDEVALGLVPLGTGNDLARGVGLPLEPVEAARLVATGEPRALAVAEVGGWDEVVVNNAHLGVGAEAAARATGLKPRLGPLAYPAGALVAGIRPEPVEVAVDVDGSRWFGGEALALVLALGPSAGGGHELAPRAEPTEDAMEVVVITPGGAAKRLGLALDVLRGRDPARRDEVERASGTRVRVAVADGEARWDVDGELVEWESEVEVAVRPAAWRLVTPSR